MYPIKGVVISKDQLHFYNDLNEIYNSFVYFTWY